MEMPKTQSMKVNALWFASGLPQFVCLKEKGHEHLSSLIEDATGHVCLRDMYFIVVKDFRKCSQYAEILLLFFMFTLITLV